MRKWIKQKQGTKNCGAIAIAVIAKVSLKKAIEACGTEGPMNTKDLVRGIRKLGYTCPDHCKRKRPELGIGHLTYTANKKNRRHWVAIDGNKIYDGFHGKPDGTVDWNKEWKLTSYLPVKKI
ncbi:MAG TPA: hypothetical protein PKX15_04045 [Bacteroidales bacterium]|nr:hypothetical protein [Bacteroidales bacterium]